MRHLLSPRNVILAILFIILVAPGAPLLEEPQVTHPPATPAAPTPTPRPWIPSLFESLSVFQSNSDADSILNVTLFSPVNNWTVVPIEPLDTRSIVELRRDRSKKSGAKKRLRILRPLLNVTDVDKIIRSDVKMYFFDLGARLYPKGSYIWFLRNYPHIDKFEKHILMDVLNTENTYPKKELPLMKFIHAAAWIHDRGVMIKGYKMGRVAEGGGQALPPGRTDKRPEWKIRSVDMAAYLKSLARVEDFVVMKLDIEGGEWELLEHLYRTGALFLIDELFLECHSRNVVMTGEMRMARDCVDLFNVLRRLGVYAHTWY
eukprot:PhM_4_TR10027/c3_g1_i5/m.94852